MVGISFEFFPPKTPEMEKRLWDNVEALAPLAPRFVSVTYGAGGTTRERTHAIVERLCRETKIPTAAHLTCVGAHRAEVDAVARAYWEVGVRHIVALRGDPPQAASGYVPHPQGYRYAADLVAGLRRIADFEITVAAFPEKHPESRSFDDDMRYLQQKVDAGATRAITQYFFDVDCYVQYVERVRRARISIPIVPGILPITSLAQVQKFSAMCGASVPAWLIERFTPVEHDARARAEAAITVAVEQCRKLLALGVTDLHFYTLNRADLTAEICARL